MKTKKRVKRAKRTAATRESGDCGTAKPGVDGETVTHVSEAPCSVEFMRDAKGHARWALKLYGNRDEMDTVLDEVLALDKRLRERHE